MSASTSGPLPAEASAATRLRTSRRTRNAVKYYDTDDEDFADEDDNVYCEKPPTKKLKVSMSVISKPPPKTQIFPFMTLPPEIRNTIYKMALDDPAGHHLVKQRFLWRRIAKRVSPKDFKELNANWWKRRRTYWNRRPAPVEISTDNVPPFLRLSPRVLQISKTIYGEAAGMLYSQSFVFTDTYALHDFLVQIGPKHRAMLRDVEVCEWGDSGAHGAMNYPAMAALADAVNLERLKLNFTKYGSSQLAAKVWRDCYPFFEAYGIAKGARDAVVDILELYDNLFTNNRWDSTARQYITIPSAKEKDIFQKKLRYILKTGRS